MRRDGIAVHTTASHVTRMPPLSTLTLLLARAACACRAHDLLARSAHTRWRVA